jgi:hypothetical protein
MLKAHITLHDRLDVYQRIRKDIEEMGMTVVKVGFPQEAQPSAPERKGTHPPASTISEVAEIAAFQEFGTERIPARPFFRQTVDNTRHELPEFTKREYDGVLRGAHTVSQGLSRIGEWMAAKMKRTITTGDFEPLSARTIQAKGSSRPLIDTGQMRASVTYVVTQKAAVV